MTRATFKKEKKTSFQKTGPKFTKKLVKYYIRMVLKLQHFEK